MKTNPKSQIRTLTLWPTRLLILTGLLAGALTGLAQPTLVSTTPANMATGVSPTAPVVFVFSEAMNPDTTAAQFMDATAPLVPLPVSPAWSAGNTVLSCAPAPSWPANKMIVWVVDGESAAGDALTGDTAGVFTTGSSGGGPCTNEIGSVTIGKGALYRQESSGAATLQTNSPFAFVACCIIACSNATTTNVTLTLPGGALRNLPSTLVPGHDSLTEIADSLAALDGAHPDGDYVFTFQSPSGNVPVTVNFPAALTMPNAPHVANFAAAQSANPAQPFVLSWDAFAGASGQDCIYVEIYGGVFHSPLVGAPNVLPGSARSVTIPPGTLESNHTYEGALTFYHLLLNTNSGGYVKAAYRAATTEFNLATSGGVSPLLRVSRTATNTVVLSWPAPADNWVLEHTNRLGVSGDWPVMRPPYTSNSGAFFVTLTNAPSAGPQFFRLHNLPVLSSRRFKTAIQDMGDASDTLLALRPVTFRYKPEIDPQGAPQFGLVAEEVEAVNPTLVVHDAEGRPYAVRYDAVNAMLLNEFLKEHKKVEGLESRLEKLERLLNVAATPSSPNAVQTRSRP